MSARSPIDELVTPPVVPPSRWLLGLTISVVCIFTALRFWLAATLDFRSDEAYYWTWSQQWAWAYLDHPPMVAWLQKLGQAFFGDTLLGARFGQLVALPIIELLLGDIARRRTRNWNAALFVVLLLEATAYYGLIVAIVEPSIPLLLFAALMLWSLCRLDETEDGRWWLLAGAAGGLALMSKYIAILLVPAVLALLLSKRHRRWLVAIWPYAGAGLALVIFSPVLIWNARNGWISFMFQSGRLGAGHAFGIGDLWRFLLYDAFCAGLLLLPLSIIGSLRLGLASFLRGRAFEASVVAGFLFPLGYFLARSLTMQINQSWAFFVWPIGVLALVLSLDWTRRRWRRMVVLAVVIVPGLPFLAALFFHATVDNAVWLGRGDPFGQDAGFGQLAERVLALSKREGAGWIATTEYRTYANLQWHIGDRITVVQVDQRSRFIGFSPQPEPSGRALYVYRDRPSGLMPNTGREPLSHIALTWRGARMADYTVETLDGFAPDFEPPPGSPWFEAAP